MLVPSPLLLLGLVLPSIASASIGTDHPNDPSRPRGPHNHKTLRLERKVVRSSSAALSPRGGSSLAELYQQMADLQKTIEDKKNGIDAPVVTVPVVSNSTLSGLASNQTLSTNATRPSSSVAASHPTMLLPHPNAAALASANQTVSRGNATVSSAKANTTASASGTASKPAFSTVTRSTSTASTQVSAAASAVISNSAPASSPVSTAASASASPSAAATSVAIPASSGDKAVFVHHMIGNTYPYTPAMWTEDIKLAHDSGFDGFALNLGTDSWQIKQLGLAYDAAAAYGPSFKLFISFDFTVFPCASAADASTVVDLAAKYATHPNQAMYQGTSRPIVSTFSGSDCSFGQGDWNKGFKSIKEGVKSKTSKDMFFVPSVFADPSTFSKVDVMDGELNWNGGWPTGDAEITFDRDETYLAALGSKAMMASVSTGFFTHYSKSSWSKNWIYVGDDFLFAKRWELLVQNRAKFDLVEALTWNDYGESTYLGPIKGAQPKSEAWVDGFDHLPLLEINKYYSEAYKTGVYPAVKEDKIFLSARPHHNQAVASNDDIGRPTGGQDGPKEGYLYAKNDFFAFVLATADGDVELQSGSTKETFPVKAGANFLKLALTTGSGMSATLSRGGKTVTSVAPKDYVFEKDCKTYNWNMKVFSS